MNISIISIINDLEPAVIIAAFLPFVTAVFMWVHFYSNYDFAKLKKIRQSLRKLADNGEKLEDCQKENIVFMDELSVRMAPGYFYEAWLKMKIHIEKNYQGDYIPEGQSFFDFTALVDVPGCRNRLDALWKSFWVIGMISVVLPFGIASFIRQEASIKALIFGMLFLMLICLGQLIFTLVDQRMYFSTKIAYQRFIDIFNKVLPTTKAEVALLLEATQQNREVYEISSRRIVEKFDNIVEEMILPVLQESISVIMDSNLVPALQNIEKTLDENLEKTFALQDRGMKTMTEAFANQLVDVLESKMTGLSSTIENVQTTMKSLNQSLTVHISGLTQSMQQTLELQEKGMERIGESFTNKFTNTLEIAMHDLSIAFGGVKAQMEDLNCRLDVHVSELSVMLTSQREVQEQAGRMLIDSGEIQAKTLSETKEIQYQASENSRVLNEHVHGMADTLERLTEQTMSFSKEAFQFTKDTNEAQHRMSEDVKISNAKLEAAVHETMVQYTKMRNMISDMMDHITDRMNDAMTNAGREIALGIKEVTADNAEAIANLTEQAQNLRQDYDIYFNRLADSTLKTLEDMDYQVKNIIARITEDVGVMLKESIQANGVVLEGYKENTADLLQSFDEQARSIGLYAKEINLDISELSNNLQASAGEFSGKMQEGVRLTINEFDNGLSELAQRLANTVESICDAVEALPSALDRK